MPVLEPGADDWRPAASRLAIEARARLLADIRSFFAARKVLEVETAILSQAGNTDPNIACIRTDAAPPQFLRTSPEYAMKRLLAAGLTDIFELGRVFRAGESGSWHNPEFTLLEWYRKGWDYHQLADEVVELVKHCAPERFGHWKTEHITYRELFLRHTGLDPFLAEESEWAVLAAERNIRAEPMEAQQWQDLMLTHVIQPAMDAESITVLLDFPPEQAALSRIRPGSPAVAERFEVYLGRAELANGYHELQDAGEQLERFERENRLRAIRGEEPVALDYRLIEALRHGLPECSGVALGVDRLLMRITDMESIEAVLTFPRDRA
jgi:lysyl-tRNA synthetase class 2